MKLRFIPLDDPETRAGIVVSGVVCFACAIGCLLSSLLPDHERFISSAAFAVVSVVLAIAGCVLTVLGCDAPRKTLHPLFRWLFWHRLRSDDRWRRGDIMRHRDGTWDWIDWQDIGWYALAVHSYRRYSVARWWAKRLGKWRLSWDLCPSCNSDAPAIDTCPVCHGHTRLRGDSWPPDNKTKRRWWATFEDRVDCGYE